MAFRKDVTIEILKKYGKETGTVFEIDDTNDERLIIILRDNPANLSERSAIAKALKNFLNTQTVELVGVDGAWGDLDIGLLKTKIENGKLDEIEELFEEMKLSPVEYVITLTQKPFILYGVDDETSYKNQAKLWIELTPLRDFFNKLNPNKIKQITTSDDIPQNLRHLIPKMNQYTEQEQIRSKKITKNLLDKMSKVGAQISVLVCCGILPDLITENLRQEKISYARIEPSRLNEDKLPIFERNFLEQDKASGDNKALLDAATALAMYASQLSKQSNIKKKNAKLNKIYKGIGLAILLIFSIIVVRLLYLKS